MGLLEQLLAKLDALTSRLDALENGQPTAIVIENKTGATVVTEQTESSATVTTVELDKNGIHWDERIHAGTKRKNADGTWSMKKGVGKDLYAEIMAELTAAASESVEPVVQTAPQKPGAPTKPSAPVPPTKPAPTKPDATGATVKAARAANTLVNDFKVDYDDIVETLLKPLGVDAFGSLTSEQATEVLKGLESWVKALTDLKEEFDGITKMVEGTEHVATITEGLTDFVTTHGGTDGVIGSVPYANIHELYKEVCEWANQWEEFLKAE
jgi:hypothetical protein